MTTTIERVERRRPGAVLTRRVFGTACRDRRLPGRLVGIAVLLALLIEVESGASSYSLALVQQASVDACLGLAVVVLLGFAGELSFAYGVLFGISGYVAYYLMNAGFPMWPSYAVGVLASTVAGTLIAVPALRIRQLQLALATFGAGIAGIEIFGNLAGGSGIVGLKQLYFGGDAVGITDPKTTALFAVGVLAVVLLIAEFTVSGRLGRRWLVIKAREDLARSFAVSVPRERLIAFAVSSALLGIIGAVYPTMLGLLSADSYQFQTVINVLIIAILGGLLRPGGALLGALIFAEIGQHLSNGTPGLSQIVYGALLLALLLVLPRGLVGIIESLPHFIRRRRKSDPGLATVQGNDMKQPLAPREPILAPVGFAGLQGQALTKSFGGFTAVSSADIDIRPRCITGIIGANGAGKSTLLDLLTGFKTPDSGTVRLAAESSLELSEARSWRRSQRGVRRTFQHPMLVPELTVLENVAVAVECAKGIRPRQARGRAAAVLADAGLTRWADALPEGLPYGVVKLVDVARLVATDPVVAFFDEPAAGLGEAELPALASYLRGLAARGAAVVLIEHNLDFIAEVSDELVAMDFGRVVASGKPKEVLESDAVAAAYSVQASIGLKGAHDA